MDPSTLTETTPYEQALAMFRSLSKEEQQQFIQQLEHEQLIPPRARATNATALDQRVITLRDDIRNNPLYTHGNSFMKTLTLATEKNDTRTFIDFTHEMDWTKRTAEEFSYAIDLAFTLQLWNLGKDLIMQGLEQFPNNEEFHRGKRIFFPDKPSRKSLQKRGTMKGRKETQEWFDQYSQEYSGRWVAVNQGVLIGSSASYEELKEMIKNAKDRSSTVVVKVV